MDRNSAGTLDSSSGVPASAMRSSVRPLPGRSGSDGDVDGVATRPPRECSKCQGDYPLPAPLSAPKPPDPSPSPRTLSRSEPVATSWLLSRRTNNLISGAGVQIRELGIQGQIRTAQGGADH